MVAPDWAKTLNFHLVPTYNFSETTYVSPGRDPMAITMFSRKSLLMELAKEKTNKLMFTFLQAGQQSEPTFWRLWWTMIAHVLHTHTCCMMCECTAQKALSDLTPSYLLTQRSAPSGCCYSPVLTEASRFVEGVIFPERSSSGWGQSFSVHLEDFLHSSKVLLNLKPGDFAKRVAFQFPAYYCIKTQAIIYYKLYFIILPNTGHMTDCRFFSRL